VSPELFRKQVSKAIDAIPEEFRQKMDNVEILVEEFPDGETLESLDLDSVWDLLGLYVGVPLTGQSFFSGSMLPDRIYLYRKPILRAARQGRNVVDLIREVVLHELGHHLGFDDEELENMTRRTT
jgi:predicted Zn-dependent protease with MMP-like domain